VSKALVIYLMAGADTPQLAAAAVEGGADIVEIGFPFSDPLADGPVIRAAAERALAAGMRTAACLECLASTRALVGDTPLIPMTYASLLEAFQQLSRLEGIIPALESSHALAVVDRIDAEYIAVCLSGRGDKDLAEVLAALGKAS